MQWWRVDDTHDPARTSWVDTANGHPDFPVQNLPYGSFSPADGEARIGVAIGDEILDLRACSEAGLLPAEAAGAAREAQLGGVVALGCAERRALRARLSGLLSETACRDDVAAMLHPASACTLHLPLRIGDYTDFYVGIHHATNVGRQFRSDKPLLPNYKYVPIGYHGRASSVRPSGIPLVRPRGQSRPADGPPLFAATGRLDYELELGVWIGSGNALGAPIAIGDAARHIAGLSILNDWSARDFQAWEYQPLGPFLAKNFHTTVSPWIVTTEALAPFRLAQPTRADRDPAPLPYLWDAEDQAHGALALTLEVFILTPGMRARGIAPFRLSRGPASNMYWTIAQMVTHHTSNGCNLHPGDLLGTGTISAPTRDGFGSMLELTAGGQEPIALPDGEERGFLQDGDEIIMRARSNAEGFASIGFGECRATVAPANEARSCDGTRIRS